jgi:hypothetical protein
MTTKDEIKKVSKEVMEFVTQRHGLAGAALTVAMLIEDDRMMEGWPTTIGLVGASSPPSCARKPTSSP